MRVFTKLVTAVRGSGREAAEAVVDANAIRIFGQEIYDCEAAIQQAKRDLSRVVAENSHRPLVC
jgi:phage shock protein A